MVLKLIRPVLVAAVMLGALGAAGTSPSAWAVDLHGNQAANGALFRNYYVPPGPCGGVPAQLYLCPRPTPPMVGHTYVTYQPLMPHEFLYQHQRVYVRQNPGAGWTVTKVHWR